MCNYNFRMFAKKRWNGLNLLQINVLLQFFTDISLGEKRVNNLV